MSIVERSWSSSRFQQHTFVVMGARGCAHTKKSRPAAGKCSSRAVLLVADLFHPVDDLAVEMFLNGSMGHGRGWRGTMPVLHIGRNPHRVARPDFVDRAAPLLHQAHTRGDDQHL